MMRLQLAALLTLAASAVVAGHVPLVFAITVGVNRECATLEEAVAHVRKLPPDRLREIVLGDGLHFVEKQLTFSVADSNLVFRAEHPGKAVITGAKSLISFHADKQDERLVEADFPFTPEPETLYVFTYNGRLAEFAAYPQYGGDRKLRYNATDADVAKDNRTVLRYDPLDLPEGFDFRHFDCASAFLFIPQEYVSTRCYVVTNDWQNNTFHLKNRTCFPLGRFNQGYQVMNTRLGLRHPGTWMFEAKSGRLRYWPTDQDRLTDVAVGMVAKTSGLFYFDGTSDVRFEGLILEGCSSPFTVDCHLKPIPGLITGHDPMRISIIDCELRNTAGAGIHFVRPKNCVTRDCHLHGLGSYGIHHFWGGTGSVVENCHVHDNGLFSLAAPAVELQGLDYCRVVSNHVHHTPGCGFVMWCEYSVFASNHLHHTMRSVRDGGGLYGGQNHSKLFDNYVHDCGDWPGLYNDEGGYGSVYYGNRFEDCWWPFHMHDTYAIVITNNYFQCKDYMRFSLQGAVHTLFKDNRIDSPLPIEGFHQLDACDEWSNEVRVRQADGSYDPAKRVTLIRGVEPPKPSVNVWRISSVGATVRSDFRGGRATLDRDARGLALPGVPGGWVEFGFDATNLYVHGRYEYNKFISYKGSVNLGHEWGRHDAIRVQFTDFDVTAFFDGMVISSDNTLVFGSENAVAKKGRSVGDGFATFAFVLPLKRLGVDGASALGRSVPFNAIFYNHDHREYKYFAAPEYGNRLKGMLTFAERPTDHLSKVSRAKCLEGVSWPGSKSVMRVETSDRRARLTALTLEDDGKACGLKILPFTGDLPAAGEFPEERIESASECARPGCHSFNTENWSLAQKVTASASCMYLKLVQDHVPCIHVLLDCPTTALNVADGVVTAEAGASAMLAFEPKPTVVHRLPSAKGTARYVLDFITTPVTGGVVMKGAVSALGLTSARAKLASEPEDFDFSRSAAACSEAWNVALSGTEPK